jgi:hypothetical protein
MAGHQVERLLHAGEHAESEHIDLHELKRVDVVLVPLDHLAVDHGGRLDRNEVIEPIIRQDKAARMLTEMARRAHELTGEIERQAKPAVGEVEVQFLDMLVLNPVLRPAPDLGGQHLDEVLGEAERLTDIADRALGAIADDGRAQRRVVAAVLIEDPLHDDLAPFMLEIDVDVWRLAAFLRHEALEQEVVPGRID